MDEMDAVHGRYVWITPKIYRDLRSLTGADCEGVGYRSADDIVRAWISERLRDEKRKRGMSGGIDDDGIDGECLR